MLAYIAYMDPMGHEIPMKNESSMMEDIWENDGTLEVSKILNFDKNCGTQFLDTPMAVKRGPSAISMGSSGIIRYPYYMM